MNYNIHEGQKDFTNILNNGIDINISIYQTQKQHLSLKQIFKDNIEGTAAYVENLNIKINLYNNACVFIIDDLIDFDITRSCIEFNLHENSELNYDLKILDTQYVDKINDGLLVACNQQGYFEKTINLNFLGQGAKAKAKCLLKGLGSQLFKFKTTQNHQFENTKSDLVIKGAFCQSSKFICDNLIKVNKNAKNVEVSQQNKNLLLGCHSQAISIPKLEVEADDVSCKHGAVVSKLNDNEIFYLQSRGMEHCKAKQMLIDSFFK
ncbi:hypothetical protein GF322_03005 [Candidatus Dependentiae bacterium]|nr:hypothetical protein [Candidatus Dependentiae bacterium]